ncbi:hypothetical protein SEA_ZANELLA_54 [Microbacterium phage Zanella]|nr:hypothetical protein SEA_ZANELLA_54 [Microbacterium phage Zanella]
MTATAIQILQAELEKLDGEIEERQERRQQIRIGIERLNRAAVEPPFPGPGPRSIDDAFDRPAPRPIKDSPQA